MKQQSKINYVILYLCSLETDSIAKIELIIVK